MMECTTGLTDDEFDGLLAWLREEGVEGYPPILGLSGSLRATLMYLRQNIVQEVIGEFPDVSQTTVSRVIKALTEAISRTPAVLLLTAEDVPRDCDCHGGRHPPPLPGPAQAPRSVVGQARERGHERPGSWSGSTDNSCGPPTPARGPCTTWPPQAPSGLLDGIDPSGWIADKGYVGRVITPHKKPPNGELSETAKEENKSVNRIRQVVERTIAHIKSWRILHTPYRRPLETFEQTITAALALYAFKTTP